MFKEMTFNSTSDLITFLFDHPEVRSDKKSWYRKRGLEFHFPESIESEIFTELFQSMTSIITRFTRLQVQTGIVYLSDHTSLITDFLTSNVDSNDKRRFLLSQEYIFQEVFLPHCEPKLFAECADIETSELNLCCYRWWDNFEATSAGWNHPSLNDCIDTYVEVLERILKLNSICCAESALIGLCHVYPHRPKNVQRIVSDFSRTLQLLSPELAKCATWVGQGVVI